MNEKIVEVSPSNNNCSFRNNLTNNSNVAGRFDAAVRLRGRGTALHCRRLFSESFGEAGSQPGVCRSSVSGPMMADFRVALKTGPFGVASFGEE